MSNVIFSSVARSFLFTKLRPSQLTLLISCHFSFSFPRAYVTSKSKFWKCFGFIFEYHTPRLVTVRHYKLGIFRLILQICILAFIFIYQLWYMKGYQRFSDVEASVITKVTINIKNIGFIRHDFMPV